MEMGPTQVVRNVMQKTKIMLVEDHPEYREVIELTLSREPNMELTSQFGTAERALRHAQDANHSDRPDVILLDLNLPGMSGLESISWFKDYTPKTKVIVLTQSDKEADILRAIKLGASGYLLKSSSVAQIKEGIKTVMNGGASLDSSLAKFILNTVKSNISESGTTQALSNREMEVLTLLAKGDSKKEIAAQLGISNTTVITHVGHIYEKLNARNAPAAIAKAYQVGIFSPGNDA